MRVARRGLSSARGWLRFSRGWLFPTGLVFILTAGMLQDDTRGEEGKTFRVVAFGDSTTAPRKVGNEALVVYADRIRGQGKTRSWEVRNAGVGGNDTSQARERFAKDVLDWKPTLVILQFGINDASVDVWKDPPATMPRVPVKDFANNMRYFVAELKRRGAAVVLMTPNPMRWTPAMKRLYGKPPYRPDEQDGFNVLLADYAQSVRDLARDENVPLVDVYRMFEDHGKEEGRTMDELLLDGVHPNEEGHRRIADRLMPLVNSLDKDP